LSGTRQTYLIAATERPGRALGGMHSMWDEIWPRLLGALSGGILFTAYITALAIVSFSR
jgi:hypothetical protein